MDKQTTNLITYIINEQKEKTFQLLADIAEQPDVIKLLQLIDDQQLQVIGRL